MNHSKLVLPSNQKFGFFSLLVFHYLAFIIFFSENIFWSYIFGIPALILIMITSINADILFPLNKLWSNFGLLVRKIVSPIIMGLIFFGIFTPIAIFFRLIGRDELHLKYKKQSTHWIKRDTLNRSEPFKQQF